MCDLALLLAMIVASYLGFALLALARESHWRQVTGEHRAGRSVSTGLRLFGSLSLALSLAASVARDGAAFGSLLWVMLLSVMAVAVALTLTWRAHWLQPVAVIVERGLRVW